MLRNHAKKIKIYSIAYLLLYTVNLTMNVTIDIVTYIYLSLSEVMRT